jgi:hypothetical protein
MAFSKQFVVLSKSWKSGGYCVAGKEVRSTSNGLDFTSNWIRPVSSDDGPIHFNGNGPQLLDVIKVPILTHQDDRFQPENYLIDADRSWKRVNRIEPQQLENLVESPNSLWGEGCCVAHSAIRWNRSSQSLYLVRPNNLYLNLYWQGKKKIKVDFEYNGISYALNLTDPVIHREYTQGQFVEPDEIKQFRLPRGDDYYLCVSLAAEWRGQHYKLVASIIEAN